jgi:peroxiredoxin Q/BCP
MRRSGILTLFVLAAVLLVLTVPAGALQVGDQAPDFTLPATTSEKFSIKEFQGKKNVVLFGFIGAFTPT